MRSYFLTGLFAGISLIAVTEAAKILIDLFTKV